MLSASFALLSCKGAPPTARSSPITAISAAPAPALPVAPQAAAQTALQAGASEPTRPLASASAAVHDAATVTATDAPVDVPYRGTLGTDHVVVRVTRTGSILEGRYFIESDGIDVPLRGTVRADGTFTLKQKGKQARLTGTLRDEHLVGTLFEGSEKRDLAADRVTRPTDPNWAPVFVANKRFIPDCKTKDGGKADYEYAYLEVVGAFSPEIEAQINEQLKPDERTTECVGAQTNRLEPRVLFNAAGLLSVELRKGHTEAFAKRRGPTSWTQEYRSYSLVAEKRLLREDILELQPSGVLADLVRAHVELARKTDTKIQAATEAIMGTFDERDDHFGVESGGIRFISIWLLASEQSAPWDGVVVPYAELREKKLLLRESPIAHLAWTDAKEQK